jgi:centrosomal protein CEP44
MRPGPCLPALQGFVERKLLLLSDVVAACKKVHNDELRRERLAALKSGKQVGHACGPT